jgi:hypothetical protein
VPIGAALTTTMRRTPVACIAWMMARVPRDVIPVSDNGRGPKLHGFKAIHARVRDTPTSGVLEKLAMFSVTANP